MSLEVDSVRFCSAIPGIPPFSIKAGAPKGLLQGKDTLETPPKHQKPPFLQRGAMAFGLLVVHAFTLGYRLLCWTRDAVCGPCRQRKLYKQLLLAAKQGKAETFIKANANHPHFAGYLMQELEAMPKLHPHLEEIVKGANVRIEGDQGFFCFHWRKHPEARQRISSHKYQAKHCYELHHFVFWLDPKGHTRFQLQKSPLKGLRSCIEHLIDLLRYRRDNRQQGPAGSSPRTETHCITVAIDPQDYATRRQIQI